MGSLSIEEPPSMESQVLTPLQSLETSFNALLTSLTTTPTYSAAPSAAQSLLTADAALTTALQALHTHQKNYARILQLRSDASALEEQIKSTIRTCVDLRKEISNIHPSIRLQPEDSDDDDDNIKNNNNNGFTGANGGEDGGREIDYETLLSFASKIGRHNSAAAKEAEDEYLRRLLTARKAGKQLTEPIIIVNGTAGGEAAHASVDAQADVSQVLIPQHERDWLEAESAMARARAGMGFPAAENLRKGALGRLQVVREQQGGNGEEAVEREVERMMGREVPGEKQAVEEEEEEEEEEGGVKIGGMGRGEQRQEQRQGDVVLPSRPPQQGQGTSRPPPPPPPPPRQEERKKGTVALDLDLWNEDDEDED